MSRRDAYIFVGEDFVDAIDCSLFKVYTYEHPDKNRLHLDVLYALVVVIYLMIRMMNMEEMNK